MRHEGAGDRAMNDERRDEIERLSEILGDQDDNALDGFRDSYYEIYEWIETKLDPFPFYLQGNAELLLADLRETLESGNPA
jgi:hypothetical protein